MAPALRAAAGDFCWLLDRGYAHDSALKLVGDRHGLEARQRTAVSRSCCTASQAASRRNREIAPPQLSGATLWVDGYNVLTTVEAALAGGVVLAARDGAYRDMASMHGSFRKVAETLPALELLGRTLAARRPRECRWLFDRPVSNSGRLKKMVEELAAARGWPWRVELVADPDAELSESEALGRQLNCRPNNVLKCRPNGMTDECSTPPAIVAATADSAILDRCPRWFNLARETIEIHIPQAKVMKLLNAVGTA